MQSISAFFDITKFADLLGKKVDFNGNQGLCHLIHILFGSFLVIAGITVPNFIGLGQFSSDFSNSIS